MQKQFARNQITKLVLIMNEIQAIRKNDERRKIVERSKTTAEIRKLSAEINKFYVDYPYSEKHGCRMPKEEIK